MMYVNKINVSKNKTIIVMLGLIFIFLLVYFLFSSKYLNFTYYIYSSLLLSESKEDAKLIGDILGIHNINNKVYDLKEYDAKLLENKVLYSNKKTLIKLDNFEVQTYKTKAEIMYIKSSPSYREVSYRIYNASKYFILSKNDGEITVEVRDAQGKKVKINKVKYIKDISKEWNSNALWVREVKKDLESKRVSSEKIDDMFYNMLLPDASWTTVLYKIDDNNILYPLTFTIISKPQYSFKFYYFDPFYIGWWNESWEYRSIYYLHNNNNYNLDNYPVLITLNDTNFPWDLANPDLSDIRVTQFNETTQKEVDIPYFLEYVDRQNKFAYLWIKPQNFTANSTITIFIYHYNPDAVDISNLTAVANFADDFESGIVDTTKWNIVNTVSVEIDPTYGNWMLRVDGGNQITGVCSNTYTVPSNSIVGYHARPESTGDWDTGLQVGNIYFISDTGTYGAAPVIGTGWTYPSGSQGSDTAYHFYRLIVRDQYQEMKDYTSGGMTTATYVYTPGPLCTITDSDNTARDALYDLIYVMELPDNETSVVYNTTEYVGGLIANITYPYNNQKIYRFENFYLNSTINARGFDLYDIGSTVLTDYNNFISYDYKENITIIDTISGSDYLELSGQNDWYPGYKDWQYRMQINITNPNTQDLTDFQINLIIDTQTLISQGKMNTTCQDIRFTYYNQSTDQETPIPYWIESGCGTSNTVVWIKVPELKANANTSIYMYYGNNNTWNASDPDNVFIFFDDFEDAYLDPNKWYPDPETSEGLDTVYNTGAMRIEGGNNIEGSCSVISIPADVFVDFWMRSESTSDFDAGWKIGNLYIISDSGTGTQCISTSICYPTGSQTDTTYHHYRLTLQSGQQFLIDFNNGITTSATLPYDPGNICGFIDSDSVDRDVFYDLLYVRKYASDTNFSIYLGSEEKNNYVYYENGIYYITLDFISLSVNYTNIIYFAYLPPNTTLKIYARTSNDKASWSSWYLIENNTYPYLPSQRYLQFMVQMNTTDNTTSPQLYLINVSYERVYNSPMAWAQYYSLTTPLKMFIDDNYDDFLNYTYIENITIGYDGSLFLKNRSWKYGLWRYRLPINITNPNTQDLTDFQINLIIDTQTLISQGKMRSNCEDIRFTYYNITSGDEYPINYWIESGCNTSSTQIWVKVPYLYASQDTTLYMYYGNPSAEDSGDPYKVFDFYDDFESGMINLNKWSGGNTNVVLDTLTNTYAAEVVTGNQIIGICTLQTFDAPFILESHLRPTNNNDFDSGWLINDIYFITDTGTGAPAIGQGSWVYPTGSQDTTSYHLYYIEVQSTSQYFEDRNNGQSASATYTYTPGSICLVNDGDGGASSRYDDIRVRKLAADMNFVQTNGNEEEYISTYPSGEYISKVIDFQTNEYSFDLFYWYGIDSSDASTSFYIRTSSDGTSWSPWYLLANNTLIEAQPQRYVQYKVSINNNNGNSSDIIDKIVITYKVTTGGFIIMQPYSIFSTSNPQTCSLEEVKQDTLSRFCNVSWIITPKQEGNYTLRVKVNSTNQYIEDSYTQTINISVFIRTSIIDYSITPIVQGQGKNITLKAKLVDDLNNPLIGYNITFYDSTNNKEYGTTLTDSSGYATLTYQIANNETLGYHTVYAIFNGKPDEFLESFNLSINYKVSSVPSINALYAIPKWQGNNQIIQLRANITDKVGVDTALIYLYDEDGTLVVDGAKMSYIGNDLYEYNFSSWHANKFKFYVWVNNTDGIDNTSWYGSFVVDVRDELSIKTEKDRYKNYEIVYLSDYDYDWFNISWKYRLPIKLYNNDDEDVYFDAINLTLDTQGLINQGKMQSNCADLRITVKNNIYVVEVNITNTKGVTYIDRPVKVVINNKDIVSNMNNDGSDIRFFEYKIDDPYTNNTYLPYWVESINKEDGTAVIWVKIPYIDYAGVKTLYMYYGNKNVENKQNYSAVFSTVVGEASTYSLDSNERTINFLYIYPSPPVVISSLNTFEGTNEAFVRVTSVSPTSFNAKIQESVALDGIHVRENASYIALLPGKWLIGGNYVEVGMANIDSNYATISFKQLFSSKPIVLTQVLSNNETDPVKTRINNILVGSFDAKLEETDTTDTPHINETIGYIAFVLFTRNFGSFIWESGIRSHNQPDRTTWFTYTLTSFTSIPSVVAKIMSENGGDNIHERINNVIPSSFMYKMEEEAGYDGSHITEDNGYLAVSNTSLIYGLPYDDYSLPVSLGRQEILATYYEPLPYWIEDGCNTPNTTVWVQIPVIKAHSSTILYAYYGNPTTKDAQNKEDVFSYPFKKSLYYIMDEDIANADLNIAAYYSGTEVSVGTYNNVLNTYQLDTISKTDLTLGEVVKSNKPISTTTLSIGNGDALTPIIAKGTKFISYAIRGVEYLTIKSLHNNNYIEIYEVSAGTYTRRGYLNLDSGISTTFIYDFLDGNAILVNSTYPILLHRKAETDYDFFTVFPPTKEWYGVPSNYLAITALEPNTNLWIYRSDQSLPTTLTLTNAGDSYTLGTLGTQGNAPAVFVKSDKPVYVLAYADGDGTEGTTFLPSSELDNSYLLPEDAEYVAIATKDAVATCYVYDQTGLVYSQVTTSTNNSLPNPGHLLLSNVVKGSLINCTSPFFAYFERASLYETNLYGPKHYRKKFVIHQENLSEEDVYNNLKNNGNTTLMGYLYMIVEKETLEGWTLVFPGGILLNDLANGNLRSLAPGEQLNISAIWKSVGGWDTSTHDPGRYRVHVMFLDDSNNIIKDSLGNLLEDYYIFRIVEAELRLTKLEHENWYKGKVKEYEVGDNIALINVSVKAYNNTAINANVELNLVKPDTSYAGFGPLNEIYSCGDIPYEQECYAIFDNASYGYLIPLTAQGDYIFYWNVTMTLQNGKTSFNGTEYIRVHDLRNNVSSVISPIRIYIGQKEAASYNLTIYNPWSTNISYVNVTINCNPTLNCTCNLPGQEFQEGYCYIGNVTSHSYAFANFTINYTSSTSQGDYPINITLTYDNIGNEHKEWKELATQILEVRYQGILVITPYSYPTSVIRGEGYYEFKAYINNTAALSSTNAWLNYTLPTSWVNITGKLEDKTPTLNSQEIFWNNITVNISQSARLGTQVVTLKSSSDQGQEDFKNLYIDVYAHTNIVNITFNDNNVSVGESVIITATLVYDNGSAIKNEVLNFYDSNESIYIGSSTTDNLGKATITYNIPLTATPGLHIINVTYKGNDVNYLLASYNNTYLDVGLKPYINDLYHSPYEISYGNNISIYANVSDDDGINLVTLYLTYPNGSTYYYNMNALYSGIYNYNLSNLWDYGSYSYYVVVEDITGSTNTSQIKSFNLTSYAQVYVKTDNTTYLPNTDVYLVSNSSWYYKDRYYKKAIILHNNLNYDITNIYELITLNTSDLISKGKLDKECKGLAFTYYNATSNREVAIKHFIIPGSCNHEKTYIYVEVPHIPALSNTTFYAYYDPHIHVKRYDYSELNITSYASNITVHYPLSSIHAGSDAYAIAFNNGYMIVDTTAHILSKGSQELIASAEMVQSSPINQSVPVFIASTAADGDAFPSIAYAGKRFTYRMDRGVDVFYVIAPWTNANCNIYDATTVVDTFTALKGQATTRNIDITDGNAVILECDQPVIVFHDATSYDAYIMYPATTEWYGVASNYLMISALEDGTYVEYYKSDGTSTSTPIILNRGETYREIGLGSQGAAPAVYVRANKPIGVNAIADGDGTDGTTFLPPWELSKEYYIPENFEYIAVAVPYAYTKCDLKNNLGQVVDSKVIGSLTTPYPGHMLFGSGSAGYKLECNNSVFAYYEQLANDRETNLLGMISNRLSRGYNSTTAYIGTEYEQGSVLINHGNKSMNYYIIAYVEQNTSSGWIKVETIINDTATSTMRTLEAYQSQDIASLWNITPFNTQLYPKGTYRVVVDIVNKDGDKLNSIYGYITNNQEFNINSGELRLNISSIRVYNVTNSLNPHTSTIDLEKESINDTFIMYSNEIYRIEVDVNVSSTSSVWWINETNVSYENLDPSWTILTSDIWYMNSTDTSERNGGTFTAGVVEWNTTGLNGKEDPGGKVTFYFILNLSNANPNTYQVIFKVIGSGVGEQSISTFRILSQDRTPPVLYGNIYGLNISQIIRGEAVLAYARWNEEIANAMIEYNSTTSTLLNYTIILPSSNPYNWTNYTITTGPLWLLGNHTVKIYAEDLAGNMNATLQYLPLSVYGLARVTSSYINATNLYVGESVSLTCHVDDVSADPDEALSNYEVAFYNSTQLLGTNLTNSTGDALWIYTDYSPGTETITCNISDDSLRFYKIDSQNYASYILTTYEPVPPTYYYQSQSHNLVHKGDLINLSVLWKDNYELAYATLEINTTNTYTNETIIDLGKSQQKWANITYQLPTYMAPGVVAWRQYGNDTSNNWNITPYLYFEVWGWAKIISATATPSSLYTGNSTIIKCQVVDANQTTRLLQGYAVYFYNSTQFLGVNYTDVNGYATWNYTDWSEGQEQLVCNITHNATLKYNASNENQGTIIINTVSSGDAEPPYIINNAYGLNVTPDQRVFRDEAILLYGWWSEELNASWYEITDISPSYYNTYYINPPYTNNWTNTTIQLNYNWYTGIHKVKLYVNDSAGNINNTLNYLNFTVWGLSQVAWVSPKDGQEINRSIIYLITNVTDYNTLACIDNYRVDYYDNETPGYYIGSAYIDASGTCYANFSWDASSVPVGYHTINAIITDDTTKYYQAQTDTSSIQIILVIIGGLNTTITNPLNGTKVYKGQTYWFNSTTREDNGSIITPETTTWLDNGIVIESCINNNTYNCENITYTIPLNAYTGWHKIEANTSAPYYQRGHDEIWLLYWGLAEVNLTTPVNGTTVFLDTFQTLQCNVTDSGSGVGIQNYYVEFYVYNDTYMQKVNTSFTDVNGVATSYWYVNSSIYRKKGYYNVICNITNNATLAYDVNIASSKNTVFVNESPGYLVVNITFPPEGIRTYVGKDANFTINATATCYGGNCGSVYATLKYNGLAISSVIGDTPFYINDGGGNPRLCGTLNIGDSCNITFIVNATGDYGSIWNITVEFSSSYSSSNETSAAEIFIGYVILLSVEPSNITEWYMPDVDPSQPYLSPPTANLDPSTKMNKAANTTVIRLLPGSASANGGLWIKGENLTSQENPSYWIPVYNLTRCFGEITDFLTPNDALACWNNPDNKLTYEYKQILSSLDVGNIINITFFVDVPPVASGIYNGTIWFLANATY